MTDNRLHEVNKYNAKRWNKPAFMPKEEEDVALGKIVIEKEKPKTKRKKDTVYTVNKHNQALFTPNENLFWGGGDVGGNVGGNWASLAKEAGMSTTDYMNDSGNNWFGLSKKDNPFSKGNIGGTMKGLGTSLVANADKIDTGDRNGLFDTLDPVYHLAGGRESGVGNALSDTGVALTKSGNPWLMLAGAGLKIVGGLTNAAFGIKEDKAKKAAADQSINTNRNFLSNAGSFDDIKGPAAASNTNVYEGGWFSGGKAEDKNNELAKQMADAYSWADRSVNLNVRNLASDQISNQLRNFSALGGPLFMRDKDDNDKKFIIWDR